MRLDGMADTIGSIKPPPQMDTIPKDLNHLLMLSQPKLTSLIHNSTISPKASQVIDSKLNGVDFSKLTKEVSILSKLDLMMDQDFGLTMFWLLITGVCMEPDMSRLILSFQRDIMRLKFTCSKMVEVLLLMPTGIQKNLLILNQFTFITQLFLSEILQTQYI